MDAPFFTDFKEQCALRMGESLERIEKCLGMVTHDELWRRPNSQLSSIANLVLHLCGNIRQYAISSLGNMPDSRERAREFAATEGYTAPQLAAMLRTTVTEAVHTIDNASQHQMMRTRTVQGFSMTGVGICIHVTEHLSYHTGQIALHTKLLRNQDLGFYASIDLEVRNTEE